ncbi:hypothetical protein IAU60_003577 [Kwoniella sp. DSM 27419]
MPVHSEPDETAIILPPFPLPLPGIHLTAYGQLSDQGLWLHKGFSDAISTQHHGCKIPTDRKDSAVVEHDASGTPLIPLGNPVTGTDTTFEAKDEQRREKRWQKTQNKRNDARVSSTRVAKEDCWKIGHLGSSWVEPERTSISDYNKLLPPFTRLLSATRDFITSRTAEFQYGRNKRLFLLLRNAVGLEGTLPGAHWPGFGDQGQRYIPPNIMYRQSGQVDKLHAARDGCKYAEAQNLANEEVCVLLTKPETSIRGFLALARREAQAGWHFDPAYKLAEITAAFMWYLIHHDVVSEEPIRSHLAAAAEIARAAPAQLLDALSLENALSADMGWNRCCWLIFGGSYGSGKRGGVSQTAFEWASSGRHVSSDLEMSRQADAAGWTINDPEEDDDHSAQFTRADALSRISHLLGSSSWTDVRMLDYLPYSRRKITHILPPLESDSAEPSFTSLCHRLVTVPAPWTPDEKWRTSRVPDELILQDDPQVSDPGEADFDKEQSTMTEPEELTIWVELESLAKENIPHHRLVGMGLRGRWGRLGLPDTDTFAPQQWWMFQAKDYVLPAFWQKSA